MTLSGHPKVLSHQLPFSRSPSHMPLHLTLPRAAAGPAQGPPRWHHTEELPWLGSGAVKAAAGVVGKIRASWLPCGRPSLAQHSTAVWEKRSLLLCAAQGSGCSEACASPSRLGSPSYWHLLPCTLLPFLWACEAGQLLQPFECLWQRPTEKSLKIT